MTITVAIVQMKVMQGDPDGNLGRGEAFAVEAKQRGAQLVCFPEMWTTGFNWGKNRQMAGRFEKDVERVGEMARQLGVWVNGSMPMVEREGRISNASVMFDPQGRRAGVYRKVHLFSLFREPDHVAAGNELVMVDGLETRMGLAVCYDLRFPEMFRAYAMKGVEVQLCPAGWPVSRIEHWRTLARARAIEDQMFVVGANQVGEEDFGVDGIVAYGGKSMIVDPWGEVLAEGGEKEEVIVARIDLEAVQRARGKIPVLKDRRADVYGM